MSQVTGSFLQPLCTISLFLIFAIFAIPLANGQNCFNYFMGPISSEENTITVVVFLKYNDGLNLNVLSINSTSAISVLNKKTLQSINLRYNQNFTFKEEGDGDDRKGSFEFRVNESFAYQVTIPPTLISHTLLPPSNRICSFSGGTWNIAVGPPPPPPELNYSIPQANQAGVAQNLLQGSLCFLEPVLMHPNAKIAMTLLNTGAVTRVIDSTRIFPMQGNPYCIGYNITDGTLGAGKRWEISADAGMFSSTYPVDSNQISTQFTTGKKKENLKMFKISDIN